MAEKLCVICEETGCDFETRCSHFYHFECLECTVKPHEKLTCRFCSNEISICGAVEEVVKVPSKLSELAKTTKFSDSNLADILSYSTVSGNLNLLRDAISIGADIHIFNEYILRKCAFYGHLQMVQFIMSVVQM